MRRDHDRDEFLHRTARAGAERVNQDESRNRLWLKGFLGSNHEAAIIADGKVEKIMIWSKR